MVQIRINLCKFYLTSIRKSQFIQNRRQPRAMRSPGRIKFQEHGAGKIEDLSRKSRVGNLERMVGEKTRQVHRRFALAANCPFFPSLSGNAIPSPAPGTANDYSIRVHASTPFAVGPFGRRPALYYIKIKGRLVLVNRNAPA